MMGAGGMRRRASRLRWCVAVCVPVLVAILGGDLLALLCFTRLRR